MTDHTSPHLREKVPLSEFTTLGVGGPAKYFCTVTSELELEQALDIARARQISILILGGGSNLVIADKGFDGLVIHIALSGLDFDADGDDVIVRAKAGEEWDRVVARSAAKGLAGIENLSGIPGYVGGTPIQNVGAYGQEVGNTIESVRLWDRRKHEIVIFGNAECGFGYRASRFNTTDRDRFVVLEVAYRLHRDGISNLKYRDLSEFFSKQSTTPSLTEVRSAVLSIRAAKGMVIDPQDPDSRSAGSFFKNPIVTAAHVDDIRRTTGGDVPSFPAGDRWKLPAAWLIEQAGFARGYVKGRAGISSKHSLAIINCGGATASEIVALATEMRERVKGLFDIDLEAEPVLVG